MASRILLRAAPHSQRQAAATTSARLSHSLAVPYTHQPVTPFTEDGVPSTQVRPLAAVEKKWDFWTSSGAFSGTPKSRGLAHVPFGEVWVVERFGRYSRTLNSGVHVLVPGVDSVKCVKNAHTVATGVTVPAVKTKDGSAVDGYAVVHFNVVDPQQSAYYVDLETGKPDSERALAKIVRTTLEKKFAGISVSSKISQADKTTLKDAVLRALKREEGDMGLEIVDVEIRGAFPTTASVPAKLRAMDPPPLDPNFPGHQLAADYWTEVFEPPFFNKYKYGSAKEREVATASSLEWSIPSPPDFHHFNQIPRMTIDAEDAKLIEAAEKKK